MKHDSWFHTVFTEQGSSALQLKAAKVMDTFTRLPGCAGQRKENSQIGMSRHLDSSTTRQMAQNTVHYGRPSRSSQAESVRSSFGRTTMGKAIREYPFETWLGEDSKLGMSLCTSWKRIILICVCEWHNIGWKETKSSSDVEIAQQRSRFGRTNIFPVSCILGLPKQNHKDVNVPILPQPTIPIG